MTPTVVDLIPGEFSSTEVVDLAGVTYRQLDYWCRTGVLSPRSSNGKNFGSGSRRIFCEEDVRRARLLGGLSSLFAPGPSRTGRSFLAAFRGGGPPWVIEGDGVRVTVEVTT